MTGFFERHASKIDFNGAGGCWLWTAGRDGKGYGHVKVRGKVRRAHRESYETERGPGSADGMVVRHRCDTPACVNPGHLEIGTQADNMRDRDERGRHRCVASKGSANGSSKLTEADIVAIRAEYVPHSREHGTRALGRRFGVDHSVVSQIVNREAWRHVS